MNMLAVMGDLAMILLGLVLGYWFRFKSGWVPARAGWWTSGEYQLPQFHEYIGLIVVGAIFLFLTYLYLDLYQVQNLLRIRRVANQVVKGAVFWLFAYLSLSLVLRFSPPISRIYVAGSFFSVVICLLFWRLLLFRILRLGQIAEALRFNVLFVGWNSEAVRVAELLQGDPHQPYRLIGCVPAPGGRFQTPPTVAIRQWDAYEQLSGIIQSEAIDMVVLADVETSTQDIVSLSNQCERDLVQFKIIPSYFQILVSGLKLDSIAGVPIMGVTELPLDRIMNRFLKRSVDIVGAVVGVLLATPIVLILGIFIFLESPGSILFSQERVGRGGRVFRMLKLRSMRLGSDRTDHIQQSTGREDPRLLRIGTFIRRWNLDEVPQFWNVLAGDMSLVGPRPERTYHSEQLSFKIPHYNARLASKPGMTGWAQVNGLRGDTDLVERVRYDLHYLENWSLWLDFQIMVQTFFKRDNAY
jgi:hypothetical protein